MYVHKEHNANLIKKQLNIRRLYLQAKRKNEIENIDRYINILKEKFYNTYHQSFDDYIKIKK
jgi:hypothetical protein